MPRHRIPKQMRTLLLARPASAKHFARLCTFRLHIVINISRIIRDIGRLSVLLQRSVCRSVFRLHFAVYRSTFVVFLCFFPFTVHRLPFAVWCLRSAALNVNCAPCRLVEATRSTISARWASVAFEGMKAEGESGSRKQSKALKAHGSALPDAGDFYGHNGNFRVALTSWANSWASKGWRVLSLLPYRGRQRIVPFFSTLPPFKQLEIIAATQRLWESKSEKAIILSWELLGNT